MAGDDGMRRADKWHRPTLRALSMSVGICESGDLVGVNLHAADGNIFGHGHFDLDQAEGFLVSFASAVAELRTAQGRKPS